MVFLLPSPTPPGLAKDHKKYGFFFGTLPLENVEEACQKKSLCVHQEKWFSIDSALTFKDIIVAGKFI